MDSCSLNIACYYGICGDFFGGTDLEIAVLEIHTYFKSDSI
jgi:hypothetical protein